MITSIASVSAVVCTYNRRESLRDTIESLKRQQLDRPYSLEIVVVDNNSTDETETVVRELMRGSPWPVRYVVESHQGIAFARNRGLLSARGDLVAFIDDDAVADPYWIASLAQCTQDTDADLVGGKVVPLWLTPRPAWLSGDLMGPVMSSDYGSTRKRCTTETFLTTNCALKRASLTRFGLFDVSLGRRGQRWVGGEDLELCQRWLRLGAVVFYEPSAVVEHKVSPQRVTPEFYRRWFEDIGYTQGHQLDWKWHYTLSVMPAWRWKRLVAAWTEWSRTKRAAKDAALRTELWWLFERSFLKERWDHWRARLTRNSQAPTCHFAQAR